MKQSPVYRLTEETPSSSSVSPAEGRHRWFWREGSPPTPASRPAAEGTERRKLDLILRGDRE